MKPIFFRIPYLNVPVFGFGLLVVLAFYAGIALAVWRSRRQRLDPGVVYDLAVWMLVGGLVGARLFYVWEYWGERVRTFADVFKVWEGGIVFYGGAVGGFLGFFAFRAVRTFPVLATLDALAPSVALGAGIGRIGCFLNGCCYGDLCGLPGLGVRFPAQSPPWNSERARGLIDADAPFTLPIHPTQLYSAVDGVVLCLLLSAFFPIRKRDGEVFNLLLFGYAFTRFLIERLRDDENAVLATMTVSQVLSVMLLLFAGLLWSWLPDTLRNPNDGPVV